MGVIVDHHEAAPNSSIIDADTDIGCLSFEMLNPNIEGNRVKLADSICKEIQELYPHLLQLCHQNHPGLELSENTLLVRSKLAFDGTKSTLRSAKDASRLEIPNWLRGTVCVLSVEIDDGSSGLPLFKETNPNSGEANNIVLLWKADENNFSTLSLALSLYDKECDLMKECVYEVTTNVSVDDEELNENVDMNHNVEDNVSFIKQKIKIIVDKPKDEKLSRNAHNRAGAGSTFPCTYCTVTKTEASNPPFSGAGRITLTNKLEREAGEYITQNPGKLSQEKILKISLGQKGVPLTTAEPCQEPPDVLHEDINIVHPLFIIGSRILHFGNEPYPVYTYVKKKDQKLVLEQSESVYMNKLLRFCPTIPEITQMPGNFCREYSAEENSELILESLPDCTAKTHFTTLMKIWRELRSTHKKTNPSEQAIDEYPNLVRRFFQLLDRQFPWFKPFPNQFHRLSHNFYFMTVDNNSLGVKSLEGLEKGNFTTQVMDAHQTYKGNRKRANAGVFKLLRLKSSRLLRSYRRKPATRVQKCTSCGRMGHNSRSKMCPAKLPVEAAGPAQVDEGDVGRHEEVGDHDHGGGDDEESQDDGNESVLNLEDLLRDSDDDLF